MRSFKFFLKFFAILLLAGCAKNFDDTAIKDRLDAIEDQLTENSNAIRKLTKKLEEAEEKGMTLSVAQTTDGKILTFSDGTTITVKDGAQGNQGAQGKPGQNGDDIVVTITESSDGLYYVINMGGKEYSVMKIQKFSLRLQSTELSMSPGETVGISYTVTGADAAMVFISSSSGYAAEVDIKTAKVVITAPAELPDTGFVIVTARNGVTGEESSQYISFWKGSMTVTADMETVEAAGGIVTLTVNADCSYEVLIPDECKWIQQVESKSMSSSYVYLSVAPNTAAQLRSATVTLSSSAAGQKGVVIVQKGADITSLPMVRIDVENGADVVSKDDYLNMSFAIMNGEETVLQETGRIKGRGNATWINYPKKPYKIKLDSKQDVFGFPKNKEWVLLAEYCDRSLLRTAYLQELAKALEMPYPFHYQHVHLYLNNEYRGIYLVTEQVEKKENRVDISDDGFLFENDGRYSWEPLWFKTKHKGYYYTFKYPDPEDGEIAEGDENFNFITGLINDFEAALYGNNFKDPENGYRKYIDPRSFAGWFLAMELMANYDPNFYYVLPSRQDKILAGPVWDAEWSLGLTYKSSETSDWAKFPAQPDSEQAIWSEWKYYGRLFEDPYFVGVVKEEWAKLKPQLDTFRTKIASVAESISDDQVQNFKRWDILDTYVSVELVCTGSWEAEVEYIADFFNKRVKYVDDKLDQMSASSL